jgi:hypothetical protein
MAQILPLNECEPDVLGYALNRAQLMERGLIPFKTALVYGEAQLLFQKIGPRVRVFVQAPEWHGPGYRAATASNAYAVEYTTKAFKQFAPSGVTGSGFDRSRKLISSSLRKRSYGILTELHQTPEEEFFLGGAQKYSLRFCVEDELTVIKSFVVTPVECFGLYPAALITTKVEHLSRVNLINSPFTAGGEVILTVKSQDNAAVRTISGKLVESFTAYPGTDNNGTKGEVWLGTTIPWKLVPEGGDGSVSGVVSSAFDSQHLELPVLDFGSTLNDSRYMTIIAEAHSLRYVVAVSTGSERHYEVRHHALTQGKYSAEVYDRVVSVTDIDQKIDYTWKDAPVVGVVPSAVVCQDGAVFAAYLVMNGKATKSPPVGLVTTVRFAGATKDGVFDVALPITGSSEQRDIVRIRVIAAATAQQESEKFNAAPVFIAYDVSEGGSTRYYLAAIKVSGAQPSVIATKQLASAIPEGVSTVHSGAIVTLAGTTVNAIRLDTGGVQTVTVPKALAFKVSNSSLQVVSAGGLTTMPLTQGVLGTPVSGLENSITATGYIVGVGMLKTEYPAPAAGLKLNEKPYEFLLKPLKYTKKDDPITTNSWHAFQWESSQINYRYGEGYQSTCGVSLSDMVSDFPWIINKSRAYKTGLENALPFDPRAGTELIDNTNFNINLYRPPIYDSTTYEGPELLTTVNQLINHFTWTYPGLTAHYWTPTFDKKELVAWMQS